MENNINFIDHCEDKECGLGFCEYKCPICNHYNEDYDLYTKKYDIIIGETCNTLCENCNNNFNVYYEEKQNSFKLKERILNNAK